MKGMVRLSLEEFEMIEKKRPEAIEDADLEAVQGGAISHEPLTVDSGLPKKDLSAAGVDDAVARPIDATSGKSTGRRQHGVVG